MSGLEIAGTVAGAIGASAAMASGYKDSKDLRKSNRQNGRSFQSRTETVVVICAALYQAIMAGAYVNLFITTDQARSVSKVTHYQDDWFRVCDDNAVGRSGGLFKRAWKFSDCH